AEAALAILAGTLRDMATAFPALGLLADDPGLKEVADLLAGTDGRQIRKTVTEAMASRLDTVRDPGCLTIADLVEATRRTPVGAGKTSRPTKGGRRAAA